MPYSLAMVIGLGIGNIGLIALPDGHILRPFAGAISGFCGSQLYMGNP